MQVYNQEFKEGEEAGRGIHAAVLHGETGAVLTTAVFDTYASDTGRTYPLWQATLVLWVVLLRWDNSLLCSEFSAYLEQVTEGRLLVLSIRDEGTFALKGPAKAKLVRMGSKHVRPGHNGCSTRSGMSGWANMEVCHRLTPCTGGTRGAWWPRSGHRTQPR